MSAAEQLPGGLGVMADDVLAGLIAAALSSGRAREWVGVMIFSDRVLVLAQALIEEAREKQVKIATAETCTGGLIAGALTEIPGASEVVDRGFVVYSNNAKTKLLNVRAAVI